MALAHTPSPGHPPGDVTTLVMTTLAERPVQGWRTSELIRRLPHLPVLSVIRVITEGHRSGTLERLAPATYRIASGSPRRVAARNDRLFWGEG